jgi:hypothetical protein
MFFVAGTKVIEEVHDRLMSPIRIQQVGDLQQISVKKMNARFRSGVISEVLDNLTANLTVNPDFDETEADRLLVKYPDMRFSSPKNASSSPHSFAVQSGANRHAAASSSRRRTFPADIFLRLAGAWRNRREHADARGRLRDRKRRPPHSFHRL